MVSDFKPGNYRFIPAGFQYSSGVAANDGFEIVRVRFERWRPLADGFKTAAEIMEADGRPLTAFCACELRSPGAFTDAGFRAFNEHYVETLGEWGVYDGKTNPVARSNVCPEIDPPAEPSFYAFCYTRPRDAAGPSFVIAGAAEARGGDAPYAERITRYQETSPDAMREKVRFVVDAMDQRMATFGFGWSHVTATQAYTIHDVHHAVADELVRPGAMRGGLDWHFARPPVIGLEFEMDVRRVRTELVA